MDTEDRDAHLGSRARLDAEAESDKLTAVFSPAQPTGPDRIDDDDRGLEPGGDQPPAHTKSDHGHRMKH